MLQFIFSLYTQQPGKGDGQNACDWMMLSRVWFPQSSCQVSQQSRFTDFSKTIRSDGSIYQLNGTINLSLINVFTIPDFIPNWCQFSILQIAENATLSNAIFNINATLDLANASTYCNTNNITVAVFDQVFGNLENVTVFGTINIVNFNFPNATLLLSQLIGNVGPQFDGSKQLKNVSSNLTYTYFPNDGTANKTINTTTTVSQNQTINLTTSSFNAVIPPINKTVNISAYSYNEEIYDALFNTISNYTVLSLFPNVDNYTSVFTNLYQVSLEGFLEKTNITQNLDVKYYNSSGDEIVFPDDSIPNYNLTVYYSNYIAYGFPRNGFSVSCDGGQYLNVTSAICVSCDNHYHIFESLCLPACPQGYMDVDNICYYTCPQQLGYAISSDGTCCELCTSLIKNIASYKGCISNYENLSNTFYTYTNATPSSKIVNKPNITIGKSLDKHNALPTITSTNVNAVFMNCPFGMIIDGGNCMYPASEQDCVKVNQSYVQVQNYQTTFVLSSSYCTNVAEAGLYLLFNTSTFVNVCNGNISLQQICYQNLTQPCFNNAILQISTNNQSKCQISCGFGFVYNSLQCVNNNSDNQSYTCPEQTYVFSEFGNCVPCISTKYDFGNIWNRSTQTCVSNCSSAPWMQNETSKGLICENYSSENCSHSINYSSGQICINQNCENFWMWNRTTNRCITIENCSNWNNNFNGSICEDPKDSVHCHYACLNGSYYYCFADKQNTPYLSISGQCVINCSIPYYIFNVTVFNNTALYCTYRCPDNYQSDVSGIYCVANNTALNNQASENMYIGITAAAGVAIIATVIIVSMACCKKKEGLKVKAKLNTNSAVNYYAKQTETATLKLQRENRNQMASKPTTNKLINQGQENNQCQPQTQPKVPQVQEVVEENSEDEKKKNFQVPSPPLLGAQPAENLLQQNLMKAAVNTNLKSKITGPQIQRVGIQKAGIYKPGISKIPVTTKRADIIGQSGMGQEQGIVVQRMRKVDKEK